MSHLSKRRNMRLYLAVFVRLTTYGVNTGALWLRTARRGLLAFTRTGGGFSLVAYCAATARRISAPGQLAGRPAAAYSCVKYNLFILFSAIDPVCSLTSFSMIGCW